MSHLSSHCVMVTSVFRAPFTDNPVHPVFLRESDHLSLTEHKVHWRVSADYHLGIPQKNENGALGFSVALVCKVFKTNLSQLDIIGTTQK